MEHSFGWRYLGYSLTKLGEYDEAEKALRRANLLDIENPVIWAYLTIYCLSTGKKNQAMECLNELSKVNFCDIELMKEIGNLFLDMKEYEVAKNIFMKIKKEDITDGTNYLIIGNEKIPEGKLKQEIEYLIENISREEENLITGINDSEQGYNINISVMNKDKEENDSENANNDEEKNKSLMKENNDEKEVEIKEDKTPIKGSNIFESKIEEEKSSILN